MKVVKENDRQLPTKVSASCWVSVKRWSDANFSEFWFAWKSNRPSCPHNLISFVVRMKTFCIILYRKCSQWRFCSECGVWRPIWAFAGCRYYKVYRGYLFFCCEYHKYCHRVKWKHVFSRSTNENFNVFITRDENFYGIHWKRVNFLFILLFTFQCAFLTS